MPIAIAGVHEQVETPSWAPWLRFTVEEMEAFASEFPTGQLVRCDEIGRPVAALTTVRVAWSGDPSELGTWDGLAGRSDQSLTPHDPDGNALAMLSIAVHPERRGHGLAEALVREAIDLAGSLGLDAMIGPFRPSGFGASKATTGDVDFVAYCQSRDRRGRPIDAWLRVMERHRMVPLKIVDGAMVVETNLVEFEILRTTYRPERWYRVLDDRSLSILGQRHAAIGFEPPDEVWECGETGWWLIDRRRDVATYVEPNLWGCVRIGTGAF